MRNSLKAIAQAADPKKALLAAVGSLEDYEIFHNNVLVATYIPSEKTAGGIFIPQKSQDENRFQGKAYLVLKCGPMAFVDDAAVKFGGMKVKPGDWVWFRPNDAWEMFIKDRTSTRNDGVSVRLIEDALIKGRVTDPSLIY